ncbi:hypothetical protein GCM10010174_07280 [Kutzneria viridogrisea]|uniref:Vacuolar-type H+-ATPase subunit H n=1 Tax=Kutzneria viridogrisea TaxID=47990 RepID=A0ABR6BUJ2_9PSEU|nr:vacuolar-type H+-ATPase subunit H [Kutzneria viridogrisea]
MGVALADFLERFRPAGTPGAPVPGAVPATRPPESETELAELFDQLADAQLQADHIWAGAAEQVELRRGETAVRVKEIIDQARSRAGTVRAESMQALRAAARSELSSVLVEAQAARERLLARAGKLMPNYLDLVVAEATSGLR